MGARMIRAALLAASVLITAHAACAAESPNIALGYIPSITSVSAYVAQEDGIFARHGLHVTMSPVNQGSSAVAGIVSGSLQISTSLPTNFIQAAAGGLDIEVIANSHIYPTPNEVGVLVPHASAAHGLADLAGKRVGVNGLQGIQHMLLLKALMAAHVDPRGVTFVEVSFPQMPDMLKARTVDGVTISEPYYQRVVSAGIGRPIADLQGGIPPGTLGTVYIATRDWADAHPATVRAFRESLVEAVAAVKRDPERARQIVGRQLKFGPDVVSLLHIPNVATSATPAQIVFWINLLRETGFLTAPVEPARLVAPWPDDLRDDG